MKLITTIYNLLWSDLVTIRCPAAALWVCRSWYFC